MATSKNNPSVDPADVGRVEAEALAWTNILGIKRQINKADKEEKSIRSELAKLGKDQIANSIKAEDTTKRIANLNKLIAAAEAKGNREGVAFLKMRKQKREEELKDVMKTAGGALKVQALEAKQRKAALTAERDLLKGINKERGIGGKLADLFRTKEQKQQQIDIARAKAGGGSNVGGAAGGAGGDGKGGKAAVVGIAGALGLAGIIAGIGALKAKFAGIGAMAKGVGGALKSGLNAPLQSAAALISGDSLGMGGGAVSGAGATSMLGGLQSMLSTIPLVGGMLGGLVGAFKGIVDAVLGVDQANMRVARTLNISAKEAEAMRASFKQAADLSGNIAVNETRMLQSQVEIGNQLGINKQLSSEILINDVKLRDIAGVEAESRQAISQSSIITGRSAASITKSVIGQVGAFNKMVGTSFKFSAILSEASKLGGVLGLTFSKYPEKIIRTVASVKTMGFELSQLDGLADSFLDFEGSISKEMEAQVLTGKEMNLTKAREAALNNDNATLSAEITKNVGSATEYLNMNRIQQEAIAQSVGMSRDSLADVLKKQAIYSKLGAGDLKTAQAKIALMEKEKGGREKIVALIGEAGYNTISEVTTAEKLAEVMEKIKKSFVEFLTKSGLFDFITNPEKINSFVKGLTERLAGMVQVIGDIIASLLDTVGSITGFFGGDKDKYTDLADKVRSGAGMAAGGISSISNSLGGTPAQSVGGTVQKGATQAAGASAQPYGVMAPAPTIESYSRKGGDVYLDRQKVGAILFGGANEQYGLTSR
jgi:hypothetical protein